ncbi:MAG: hypothetical protein LQ341_001710 [Variospora aurantia]|nr:MAG: hypothetical protein LQ341_001710 [Variospora aurantia]
MRTIAWRKLPISLTELCLDTTLRCGQSFRWRKVDDDSTHLHYQAAFPDSTLEPLKQPSQNAGLTSDSISEDDDTAALVHHYLSLSTNLTELYEQWSSVDANFKKKAPRFAGIRVLRQDSWEALVGFICSSNNNIIRISQMMEKLCVHYGPLLGYLGKTPYHDMPSPSILADPKVESYLRQLGFGYRAKYLYQTAVMISEKSEQNWLDSLRNPEKPIIGQKVSSAGGMQPGGREGYRTAHEKLLALQGVGPKVADCVCLMGLGWGEAVPVDTHVWQIAQRDYKFGKGKHSSLTKATYDAVGNRFRSLWGTEAGWAHTVLFTADLRVFSERLSTKLEVTQVTEESMDSEGQLLVDTQVVSKKRIKQEAHDADPGPADLTTMTKVTRIKRRRKVTWQVTVIFILAMRFPSCIGLAAILIQLLVPSTQGVAYDPVPPPNLNLDELGRVALTGDFDSISLYTYRQQTESASSTNGSQALITQLPNGDFVPAATADAHIKTMCPFIMGNGEFAGVVVGGNFTSLGGIEAQGVAMYNPTTSEISPLSGILGQVSVVYCDQDTNTVYVGGDFKGADSTNAVAWVGNAGWTNLPFAGFNGPVDSITKAPNGNILFGGTFTGLGNTTAPQKKDQQIINISSANISSGSTADTAGFDDPKNIICKTAGQDGPGNTWLLEDETPGFWRADMNFGFQPTKLRIWNTHQDGRGTKTFRFTAFPINGIMNLTYIDPATNVETGCDASGARCPLSNNVSQLYQDFVFVNRVGMSAFQIDVSEWYGKGGGLNGIQLFQDDIYAYAIPDLNEPACANIEFGSNSTPTGPWKTAPSLKSESQYLIADLSVQDVQAAEASVVFKPDIKQAGNYSVDLYTPGCMHDDSCSSRGIANVTGIFTEGGAPTPPQLIYQTNNFDKYDQIYYGPVDVNSESFRATVTLTPFTQQGNGISLVAQRVRFINTSYTGGLNGIFEFDPNQGTTLTDFSNSRFNQIGTDLRPEAIITSLAVASGITYIGGNFTATDGEFKNILAVTDGNATSLPNGGLNQPVSTMYLQSDLLYIGGNFTDVANESVSGLSNIAAYDTSSRTWVALGSGVRGRVNTIVPLELNVTENVVETCITVNGDFDQLEPFESSPAVQVPGFGVWVPSRQNWLQNLDLNTRTITGKLSVATNITDSPPLLAGTISSQGVPGAQNAVSLTSEPLKLNPLGIQIQPRQVTSPTRKRAVSGQNVSGAVTGLFHQRGQLNITVIGGHFTATASNGSTINNLVFINSTGAISGIGSGLDDDSVFLALNTQADILYAGGTISGSLDNAAVNGLILYDLAQGNFAFPQPPALGGDNVAVHAITTRPKSTQVYVAGQFDTAGSLGCPSVCMFDQGQWSQPGSGLSGSVAALTWQGNDKLLVGGNISVNGNATVLANYDVKELQWTALEDAATAVPGPVTALTAASDDVSQFWVAGRSTSGSAYLLKYDGSEFHTIGDNGMLGDQTIIQGLSMLSLNDGHDKNDLVPQKMTLLVTGSLNIPNFGNASAALFNGTSFAPFILSTSGNGPGSLSQLFSEKTVTFRTSGGRLAKGFIVLIGLACALGTIFLLVVAGILLERYRRRAQGYQPAPTTYPDKTANMGRIPPEDLFGRLGQRGSSAPML